MKRRKQLFSIILLVCLVSGQVLGCSKREESNSLKVAGITKSPLYLPLFVAQEKNMFKDVDVEFINTTGGDIVNTMLQSGEIDIAFNSLNVCMNNGEDEKEKVVAIGELSNRGGITLISKVPAEEIKTIVSAKKGGLPNNILEYYTNYDIVANLSPQDGVTYFLNNEVDAIMAFEPFATKLRAQGYMSCSMNEMYTPLPFVAIIAKNKNITQQKYITFLEGIKEATKYIYENDSKEVATLVAKRMEQEDIEVLTEVIETFKKDNVWCKDITLNKEEYEYFVQLSQHKNIAYSDIFKNILE